MDGSRWDEMTRRYVFFVMERSMDVVDAFYGFHVRKLTMDPQGSVKYSDHYPPNGENPKMMVNSKGSVLKMPLL